VLLSSIRQCGQLFVDCRNSARIVGDEHVPAESLNQIWVNFSVKGQRRLPSAVDAPQVREFHFACRPAAGIQLIPICDPDLLRTLRHADHVLA